MEEIKTKMSAFVKEKDLICKEGVRINGDLSCIIKSDSDYVSYNELMKK